MQAYFRLSVPDLASIPIPKVNQVRSFVFRASPLSGVDSLCRLTPANRVGSVHYLMDHLYNFFLK
jgi:hypothetical protein